MNKEELMAELKQINEETALLKSQIEKEDDNNSFDPAATFRGAARWGLGGIDDEIAGLASGATQGIVSLAKGRGTSGAYDDAMKAHKEGRSEFRAETDAAYERSPKSYMAGAIPAGVGTALISGGLGTAAKLARARQAGATTLGGVARVIPGAVARATPAAVVSGIGLSDNDEDWSGEGLKSAALAAPFAAAGPAISYGARKAAPMIKEFGKNASIRRLLTTRGGLGGSINPEKLIAEAEMVEGGADEVARIMSESQFGLPPMSSGIIRGSKVAENTKAITEKAQNELFDFIKKADATGLKIDQKKLGKAIRDFAIDIQSKVGFEDPANKNKIDALIFIGKQIENLSGPMTARDVMTKLNGSSVQGITGMRELASYGRRALDLPTTQQADAAAIAAKKMTESVEDLVERALPGQGKAYKDAKKIWQVGHLVEGATDRTAGRELSNSVVSLSDAALIASAEPKVLLFTALKKFMAPLSLSSRATAAEFAKKLGKNPNLLQPFGKYASTLAAAAARGVVPLKAALNSIMSEEENFDEEPPSKVQDFNAQIDKMNAR